MLKNILSVLTGDIAAKFFSFLTIIFLTKTLSVPEFGIYNYTISLLGLVSISIEPFANSYLRDHRYYSLRKYNYSYILFAFMIGLAIFFFIDTFIKDITFPLFLVFALNYYIVAMAKNYYNVQENYKHFSIVNILQQLSLLAIIFVLVYFWKITDADILISYSYLLSFIIILTYLYKRINREHFSADFKYFLSGRYFKDSFYLLLYWCILPILAFTDLYFIHKFLGNYELGLYSIASKFYMISLIALTPLLTVIRIKQIDVVKEDGINNYYKKMFFKALFSALGMLLSMVVVVLLSLKYVFPEYSGATAASLILILSSFFSYLFIPFSFLLALRKYSMVFIISLAALCINLLVNFFFVPRYGIIASSSATFLTQFSINFFNALATYVLIKKRKPAIPD